MRLLKHFKNNPATFIIMAIAVAFIIYGIYAGITYPVYLGALTLLALIVGSLIMIRKR